MTTAATAAMMYISDPVGSFDGGSAVGGAEAVGMFVVGAGVIVGG